jgi:hypothetical protein
MNIYQWIALGIFLTLIVVLIVFRKTVWVQKSWKILAVIIPPILVIVLTALRNRTTSDPIPTPNPIPPTPVPDPTPAPNIIVPPAVITIGVDYQLSKHLTYGDCVATQHRTLIQENFDKGKQFLDNMKIWANTIYEPIIELVGIIPHIDSMFRCPNLNTLVGGQPTSQHMDAEAGDTKYGVLSLREAYNKIAWSKIPFSQIIIEFESWLHVGLIDQIKHPGKVGQRFITGKDDSGKTIYIPVTKPF